MGRRKDAPWFFPPIPISNGDDPRRAIGDRTVYTSFPRTSGDPIVQISSWQLMVVATVALISYAVITSVADLPASVWSFLLFAVLSTAGFLVGRRFG